MSTVHCRGAYRPGTFLGEEDSFAVNWEPTSHLSGSQGHRHQQQKTGLKKGIKSQPLTLLTYVQRGRVIIDKSPLPPLAESFTETSQLSMASAKPNYLTAFNAGEAGDKEFIVSCKGRPFSILTASQLPTPNVTYMDFSLVHELNLRMSDYQCRKLLFCGKKLRILGTISTSVQCIVNGAPGGNLQYKAHVVEDLKKMFDTHSIAGVKMSAKLLGSSPTDNDSTEPTDETSSESPDTNMDSPKPTKKRKKKIRNLLPLQTTQWLQNL